MDIDLTPTSTKSPDETEIDTPPHTTLPINPLSSLKHHRRLRRDDHRHPRPPVAVTFKECMKNHAAAIGGHAVDGCGEFMPSPSSSAADPTSLTCAACGCHRNFHRRDPDSPTSAITPPFLDFRHPPFQKRFSLSPSPPPQAAAAAPFSYPGGHVFFGAAEDHHQAPVTPTVENPVGRKRFRTKFSQEQKEKMRSFSVKVGWKMHKSDEAAVKEFCHEIGVSKGVLKVWMHNNKNTFGRKETNGAGIANDRAFSSDNNGGGGGDSAEEKIGNGNHFDQNESTGINGLHFHASFINASSSSPA